MPPHGGSGRYGALKKVYPLGMSTERPKRGRRRVGERAVKPFDATTKYLLELDPGAWLRYVGLPRAGPASVVNSDVSTVVAETDKVIRVDEPMPWLAHLELQSGRDPTLAARLHAYNALLYRRHGLPICSVAVLLRPEADGPELSGHLQQQFPSGQVYLDFRYAVVRVWQRPVDEVLGGGLATLPLAPLADGADGALPTIVRRIGERLAQETTPDTAALLWTSTYLLMGLRYPHDVTKEVLRAMTWLRDSSTYQAILAEGEVAGRVTEAREILMRLGRKRLGPPDRRVRSVLDRLDDLGRLEQLTDRLLEVGSWDELLATP